MAALVREAHARRAKMSCVQLTANQAGAPWELAKWQRTERENCTCAGQTKTCTLSMWRQEVPRIVVAGPIKDSPAYVAYEIDRGTYGGLHAAFGSRTRKQRSRARWIDIGANLGMLSIALALANPQAVGWAYEPNPSTFAHLQANIVANGLQGRLHAINAGVSRLGRPIQMPNCVIRHPGGSQMASTQWVTSSTGKRVTANRCFSGSCKEKQGAVERCMRADPSMTRIPSITLQQAFATAGVPLRNDTAPEQALAGRLPRRRREQPSDEASLDQLALLKVDCEGCEHELMDVIDAAQAGGTIGRVTGECHALTGLSNAKAATCLRVLNGKVCKNGIAPWMDCRK